MGPAKISVRWIDAVHLSPGIGVAANIVRRKIIFPDRACGKAKDRIHQAFDKGRVFEQKKRGGRITDIHGTDTAVGVILLGKEGKFPFAVFNQLMGGEHMPERKDAQKCIVITGTGISGRFLHFLILARTQ